MKSLAAFHCLVIATLSLTAVAQEGEPDQVPAAPPPISESIPQKRFVSDKLVLNVYAEAAPGSARVATIQTGDEVEELERSDNQVRVRLEDGREGWVGSNYLVSDAPAVVRLRELERSQPSTTPRMDRASAEQIAQLKKENAVLRGQVGELQSRVAAAVAPPPQGETIVSENHAPQAASETISETTLEAATLAVPNGSVLGWLIAMMFVGGVSFAGGYQALARRLRKKFGGLKIY